MAIVATEASASGGGVSRVSFRCQSVTRRPAILRQAGRAANVRVMPEQPGDVPFTNADVSKARRLLGYEPRVTMEEGIRRTVAWYNETFG